MTAPTHGRSARTVDGDDLRARTEALVRAAELVTGRGDPEAIDSAHRTVEQLRERLRHGTDHTVVALAGPTGSGKSSLFNALVGEEIARVGVTRPTTGQTQAAVFGSDDVDGLLRWLDVRDRHMVGTPPEGFDGLVLLDLPDFDSTAAEHRVEVDRLIELVDLLVWVVEPQKYADESLHHGYLRPLRSHASVQRFVLSKSDLLPAHEQEKVTADLIRRLAGDGIDGATVWPVSTTTAEGLDPVRQELADAVAERSAVVQRLDADLRVAAAPLGLGAATEPTVVARGDRRTLVDSLAEAAGVRIMADAVAHDHRRAARRATGSTAARWVRRQRPARLDGRRLVDGADPVVEPAAVGAALRTASEAVGAPIGPPWDRALRRETMARRDEVARTLGGQVIGAARHAVRPPRWWRAVGLLQALVFAVTVVGLAWLVLLVVLAALALSTTDLTPKVGIFPLPTLLFGGGIVASWLISLLARIPARIGGRRRARRARRRMDDVVERLAAEDVVVGIEAILAERAEVARLVQVATGP